MKNIVINSDWFGSVIQRHQRRIAELERENKALRQQVGLRINVPPHEWQPAPGGPGFKYEFEKAPGDPGFYDRPDDKKPPLAINPGPYTWDPAPGDPNFNYGGGAQ